MATRRELAEKYAQRLRQASDPKTEAIGVASTILEVTYTDSGEPLSLEDREGLVRQIGTELTEVQPASGGRMLKEADNRRYLEVVQALMALVRGGK